MRVVCEINYEQDTNDFGREADCVRAICSRCGHETTSWGDSDSSVKRCLVVMREECPNNEKNFYVSD